MFFLETLLFLSLNVYHESRSDDKLAQVAVAHVVLNRGLNTKEVVLKPYAFSWVHQKYHYFPLDLKSYFESVHSACVALQGHDFTDGADHYHHVKVKPYWRNKLSYVGTFGSHMFYKPMVKIKAKRKVVYDTGRFRARLAEARGSGSRTGAARRDS